MSIHELDRRAWLRWSGSVFAAGALGKVALGAQEVEALVAQGAEQVSDPGRTLVLLQLSGGNDGLSTVVPHGDDGYYRSRPRLGLLEEHLHRLDDYRGLHPGLSGLARHHAEGRMAIVEGVGYADPNRSHFKSLDIWHTADRRGRVAGEGWVGRLSRELFGDSQGPTDVVHIGSKQPYSLFSTTNPATAFTAPRSYRWVKNESDVDTLLASSEPNDSRGSGPHAAMLNRLRRTMSEARESSLAIRTAVELYRPTVAYPFDDLGSALRSAAALIHGDLGTRVISVEMGGFDTHNDQLRRHAVRMEILDASLSVFLDDLAQSDAGRSTVVLVFSEFGRRVAENASRGTDHGTAGPSFVLGHDIEGGLYGQHPSLEELDQGDLIYTIDFRALYADVVGGCLGRRSAEMFGDHTGLGIV